MSTKQFSGYDVFLIVILAVLQFSIVLDFMVISPLGAQLMRVLKINSSQFGAVVSAYGISAGLSGMLTAGFADKFDRKRLLLFFYGGFILATLFCAVASTYELLFIARIFTGIFGGVMSAISFAIVTDVFKFEVRGRVMGFIQMAFAASQILGIPIGLYFANKFDWHFPFFLIVVVSVLVFFVIVFKMRPIKGHLQYKSEKNAIRHLFHILVNRTYLKAFLTTFFLATGGFLIMPFMSPFLVNNVGIKEAELPLIFLVSGLGAIVSGPVVGSLSDKVGKYKIFLVGSIFAMITLVFLTNIKESVPLPVVMAINTVFVVFVSSRMISSSAIMSAVPEIPDRGAFMSINSSIQQMSGGLATMLGGFILIENTGGSFANFETLGYLTAASMVICAVFMYFINRIVIKKVNMEV